jgi:hypothetical protein
MPTLPIEDRRKIWRGLMRYWSQVHQTYPLSKSELLLTVTETDQWIDDNQASYNQALTHAASLTTAQKTLIFCAVALARVSIALLRRIFGEVD